MGFAFEEFLDASVTLLLSFFLVGVVLVVVHFGHSSKDGAYHDITGDVMFLGCFLQFLKMLGLLFAFPVAGFLDSSSGVFIELLHLINISNRFVIDSLNAVRHLFAPSCIPEVLHGFLGPLVVLNALFLVFLCGGLSD